MDDIVTRLREHHGSFRMAVGVNDAFILETIYGEAADEIERLRASLSELANRFSTQEAKHYRIIRSLEAERDQWQKQAISNGH